MVPINYPVVKPTGLAGAKNGKLPFTVLTPVYFPNHGHLSLERTAARAWNALALSCFGATRQTLTCTSAADVYRSYERQVAAFTLRMQGWYNPVTCTTITRIWDGKKYWLKRGYAPVATPGTSNHGWGLAVDVARWDPERGVQSGVYKSAAWTWLVTNAPRFGFSWEGAQEGVSGFEPWHLRYWAGDVLPSAVIDLEDALARLGGGA